MTDGMIEMGTISARGQVCIPSNIREEMDLKEGSKILFFLEKDSLIMKKVTNTTFEELTKPMRQAAIKSSIKEEDVDGIIHRMRKK